MLTAGTAATAQVTLIDGKLLSLPVWVLDSPRAIPPIDGSSVLTKYTLSMSSPRSSTSLCPWTGVWVSGIHPRCLLGTGSLVGAGSPDSTKGTSGQIGISVVCVGFACSQHLAGLPGGQVGGQDLVPGGLGGQLLGDVVYYC